MSLALVAFPAGFASTEQTPGGIVVEEIAGGSAAEAAGMLSGDVLLSWSRAASPSSGAGKLESPFDLFELELEEAPLGAVTLAGNRQGRRFVSSLPPRDWGIRARPSMADPLLEIYLRGKERIAANAFEDALFSWRELAEAAMRSEDGALASWVLWKIAETLAGLGRWEEAHGSYVEALGAARPLGRSAIVAAILQSQARTFEKHNDLARAKAALLGALEVTQKASPESLSAARNWWRLGEIARERRENGDARDAYLKALELQERLAAESLPVADSLNGLGAVLLMLREYDAAETRLRRALALASRWDSPLTAAASYQALGLLAYRRSDFVSAETNLRAALSIREEHAPETAVVAESLHALGVLVSERDELSASESFYQRALEILEKVAPGSLRLASTLNNLGDDARRRGDLANAAAYHRRALEIKEKLSPGSLTYATSLENLGLVLWHRGDYEASQDYLGRALAIVEREEPGSPRLAGALSNVAMLKYQLGDLDAAEALERRALEIRERVEPGSVSHAKSLNNVGSVSADRGDLAAAIELQRRALGIQQKLAPDGLEVAYSLKNLGDIAGKQGDWTGQADYYLRALAIRQRLAPGSAEESRVLHALGGNYRRQGELASAEDYYNRALDALEHQMARLGGGKTVQSEFGAIYASFYRDEVDLLVDLDRPEEAFHVSERFRAQSMLAMMAERDLRLGPDLSPEMERGRRLVEREYDSVQARLSRLSLATDSRQIEDLLGTLRELQSRREELVSEIRRASPRFASLQYPSPLDLAGVGRTLDPGTAFLSYIVGEERTLLFVVSAPRRGESGHETFSVLPIPVGRDALRERIDAFRGLMSRGVGRRPGSFLSEGEALYDILVRPTESFVSTEERILVSPDGPLHGLPFAALVRTEPNGRRSFLVEWKPLHVVVSATVYAQLQRGRRERATIPPLVAAFGDPAYPISPSAPAETMADPELLGLVTRGFVMDPLPHSRAEVDAIVGMFPGSKKYVGSEATEEAAKSIGGGFRYLHFAAHGFLDERFPMNSGIVLTVPHETMTGEENGLLQAWEIIEHMRIDADLVTLSACDTALGREIGGEGLVGLTQAFQYAGARSVLASLWSVADESTKELMKRFYGYLEQERSKDEALRLAQLDLVRSTEYAHPFHWSAFQLIGDWN